MFRSRFFFLQYTAILTHQIHSRFTAETLPEITTGYLKGVGIGAHCLRNPLTSLRLLLLEQPQIIKILKKNFKRVF